MSKNINGLSLASRGLKYKLKISFYLMSILPLFVCLYFASEYIFLRLGVRLEVILVIAISIVIAVIGYFVIKDIFDRIVAVTSEARLIAAGDLERTVDVERPDEVGELGKALNQLTQRIRGNMDEIKSYGEKTNQINLEIQRRVIVLSSLLQISDFISQGAKIEEVLKVIVDKSQLLGGSEAAYLLLREDSEDSFRMKEISGINAEYLLKIRIEPKGPLFDKVINLNKPLVVDKENKLPVNAAGFFSETFRLKNTLILPVYLKGKVIGMLGVGNAQEGFSYKKEDLELLDIFAKQTAIALENDILVRRAGELEIKDALTGLYNQAFLRSRLQEEIKRAVIYQRPCALIFIDIDNFQKYKQNFGAIPAESALKRIASLIRSAVSEIDRVARTGEDEFAILLPEKNKRQAQGVAEDIRKKIEYSYNEEPDIAKKITVSAGVSENPVDGVDAGVLFKKAVELVNSAKKQGKNRIAG
ncbi:MAG: diguanylate cyclase [Candidatus Omnitrophica bacterium]|nr:diguanylate cyclase [Candidatus Omnitrophota bacterium]MBL7210200.1 diguanylate cyclase [Candidatus Omnitrophota bacterium]